MFPWNQSPSLWKARVASPQMVVLDCPVLFLLLRVSFEALHRCRGQVQQDSVKF